jgi:hypothetical protein
VPAALLAAGGLAVFTSCTSSHRASTPTTVSSASTPPTSTVVTSSTQPSSADSAGVRRVVGGLLGSWDIEMTALRLHPTVAIGHPDSSARRGLASLFTSDSPFVRDIDKLLKSYAMGGVAQRPTHGALSQRTVYLRTTQRSDADSISFVWCSYDDSASFKMSTGRVVDDGVAITQGGGEAHRVDGRWLLYRLFQLSRSTGPKRTPNPCPKFAAAARGHA